MKIFFMFGCTMVYRLTFFLMNVLFICNLDAMLHNRYGLFPKQKEVIERSLITNVSSIVDAVTTPIVLGAASTVFDVGFDVGTKYCNQLWQNIFHQELINSESKKYYVAKTILFSSIFYATGLSQYIPSFCYNEFALYNSKNNQNNDNYETLVEKVFLHSSTNFILNKIAIFAIKNIAPISLYLGQAMWFFPVTTLFDSPESLPFRLIKVTSWFWDNACEPFVYNHYLEKEKNKSWIKKIGSCLALFLMISSCKYFFIYKNLFLGEENTLYEGFSKKEWFLMEFFNKATMPLLLSNSLQMIINGFVENHDIDNVTDAAVVNSSFNILFIILVKSYFLYFEQQKREKRCKQGIRSFHEINTLINVLCENIGV